MITYSVGVDEFASLNTYREDKEPSGRVGRGLY